MGLREDHIHVGKPRPLQLCLVLLRRKSAGQSPAPGRGTQLELLRDRLQQHDIRHAEPPARGQDPRGFRENRILVRGEVDDAVGEQNIRPAVVERPQTLKLMTKLIRFVKILLWIQKVNRLRQE